MSQRDEIARIIAEHFGWRYNEVHAPPPTEFYMVTDKLLAAGLRVPPGLTAEKLRTVADWLDTYDEMFKGYCLMAQLHGFAAPEAVTSALEVTSVPEIQTELRAAASFLDTQETPQ